ncbi:MAG TPA: TA system VapC family ribonuclease toxin [Thermoanaerobaculia bacterium]|nr:TA system VapC family ribonuclease toxin [Thermoanaerobaculia bacterium]
MTPDVNVLIAAFRRDHQHHAVALQWLDGARVGCAEGRMSLVLLPMVIVGFLRLVANRRVFIEPDSIEDAVAFVDALLDSPGVELLPCGDEWPMLRAKLIARGHKGNEVTDAWIASATESSSEHLVTFDRDFLNLLSPGDFTLLTVETESD